MSNSPLVNCTMLSPNYGSRTHKIDTITIHHMACNLSVEACGVGFASKSRHASSNYGVGTDGRIGMYVEEKNRSFCSSSFENDNRAITIEVANDGKEPDWHVSDKALDATIKLCVDICKRNNIKYLNYTGDTTGNLTMHCWFAYTECPGSYLKSKFAYIASEVNKRLGTSDELLSDSESALKIGERVRLVSGAKYTTGNSCPSFLYNMTIYVRGIDGDNITISTLKTGAITGIVNKKYLISMDNDNKTPDVPKEEVKNDADNVNGFKIGDEVKLISDAKYTSGKSCASFLYNMTLYVRGIDGDNITISTLKTGAITGIVNKKYLTPMDGKNNSSSTTEKVTTPTTDNVNNVTKFNVGDKVKLTTGAKYTTGKSCASFLFNMTLYVRGIDGDNITISTLKTGAITGIVNKKYLTKC